MVAAGASARLPLWSAPAGSEQGEARGELALVPGERFPLLALDIGADDTTGTSAESYHLWYQLALPDGGDAWAQAALPLPNDTGSDGRPSSVEFVLFPVMGDR